MTQIGVHLRINDDVLEKIGEIYKGYEIIRTEEACVRADGTCTENYIVRTADRAYVCGGFRTLAEARVCCDAQRSGQASRIAGFEKDADGIYRECGDMKYSSTPEKVRAAGFEKGADDIYVSTKPIEGPTLTLAREILENLENNMDKVVDLISEISGMPVSQSAEIATCQARLDDMTAMFANKFWTARKHLTDAMNNLSSVMTSDTVRRDIAIHQIKVALSVLT